MTPIESFFAPGGTLARSLEQYEFRPAQLAMAEAVWRSFQTCRSLLVEAGTGTGKTLAYLLPAILSNRRVVISTATKNLQEQILSKDVPLIERALGRPISLVTLKGISNYLCRRRFGALLRSPEPDLFDGEALLQLQHWVADSQTGDRGEFVGAGLSDKLWTQAMATTETRLGARCPYYSDCFVTRVRERAHGASIVVVNHALFFADLRIRAQFPEAQLIPDYDLVIFDEAHELEDFATRAFAVQLSARRFGRLLQDLDRTVSGLAASVKPVWQGFHRQLTRESGLARAALGQQKFDESGRAALAGNCHQLVEALRGCEQVLTQIGGRIDLYPNELGDEVGWLLLRRTTHLRDDIETVVHGLSRPVEDVDGVARWVERSAQGDVDLFCAPVDISATIEQEIVERVDAAIFASGTLTVGGDFGFFRRRWGLTSVGEIAIASPFDYARQARVYIPHDLPLPQDDDYIEQAAERMLQLVKLTRGRAFLLFSSWRNLHAVHERIAGRIAGSSFVQGQSGLTKNQLLEEFKRSAGAVLFGVASFWQGVDVVGDALSLVVMDKIPFAPPGEPLVKARSERLAADGEDAFAAFQLPEAVIQLAQGFGRLIRHRDDRGIVALLDSRVWSKPYGKYVRRAFPENCPILTDYTDVERFWLPEANLPIHLTTAATNGFDHESIG